MKPASQMTDEELAAAEYSLGLIANQHSPVCTCITCHRYIEAGMELYERKRQAQAS